VLELTLREGWQAIIGSNKKKIAFIPTRTSSQWMKDAVCRVMKMKMKIVVVSVL